MTTRDVRPCSGRAPTRRRFGCRPRRGEGARRRILNLLSRFLARLVHRSKKLNIVLCKVTWIQHIAQQNSRSCSTNLKVRCAFFVPTPTPCCISLPEMEHIALFQRSWTQHAASAMCSIMRWARTSRPQLAKCVVVSAPMTLGGVGVSAARRSVARGVQC